MNKIMELAEEYNYQNQLEYAGENFGNSTFTNAARAALATEVQAQQDYTSAVIAERDALKAELKKEEDAHDADVNDLNYHLRNSITNHKQVEDELEALRKAAQMALEALDELMYSNTTQKSQDMYLSACVALRKELE